MYPMLFPAGVYEELCVCIQTGMPGPRFVLHGLRVASLCTSRPMLRLLCRDGAQPASRAVFVRRMNHAVVGVFATTDTSLELLEETLEETPEDAHLIYSEFLLGASGVVCLWLFLFAVCSHARPCAPASLTWLVARVRAIRL